jgi:protein TonB
MKQALQQSFLIHLAFAALFLALAWLLGPSQKQMQKIRIEIKEAPLLEQKKPTEPPVVQTSLQKPPPTSVPPRKVFGLSRNSLLSDKTGAVEVKAGNTLAKDIDQEKLLPSDADSLPVPAEEYLVTQMPKLKNEVRIPYPPEAKAKNVEGVVVMEILIDDKGKVRQATLLEGPGYGLNEAAMKAIYDFEFAPAVIEKKTAAVRIRYAYRFILN